MANKIIFDIPGETTSAEILLGILEKNGVKDITEDLLKFKENSKVVFLNNSAKDFFDKKLSEENFINALKDKLKITKENVTEIIKDVKEKLLPYAKKVEIKTETQEEIKTISEIPVPDAKTGRSRLPQKKNEKLEEIKKPTIQTRQKSGPDNYREPIE